MGKTISKKLPDLNFSTNSVSVDQGPGQMKANRNLAHNSDSDQEILAY